MQAFARGELESLFTRAVRAAVKERGDPHGTSSSDDDGGAAAAPKPPAGTGWCRPTWIGPQWDLLVGHQLARHPPRRPLRAARPWPAVGTYPRPTPSSRRRA
eukprot:133354-Rhodomonas_salina.1